jgi:hypothetical protein
MLLVEQPEDLKDLSRQLVKHPDPAQRAEALAKLRARINEERRSATSSREHSYLSVAEMIFDFIEAAVIGEVGDLTSQCGVDTTDFIPLHR